MSNKLVKVLEYLVNEEREKASDLLHDVFVEKAKKHWAALSESDESVEEDIHEEDLDEAYYAEDFGGDDEEDFLDDIESAEDEIDAEETYEDEDMEDDMPIDGEEMDMEIDMGEIEGEEESPEPEEALANVEDAIAELRAAFADLMGDDDMDDMDDMDDEEEMVAFGEGAKMHNVNVSHSGSDDGKSSPMKDAGNDMGNPHPTDTTEEKGGKAPAVKTMGVKGPQEAGKFSAAPAPKKAE